MKRSTVASLIGLLLSVPAVARENINVNADDVNVTAGRIAQTRESTIADVTVITREEIERAGQAGLIELLQRQPGVEVDSTGGSGQPASVFLRGANSDHVVVLVDGLRLNSATLGNFSFQNMPLAQIDRIEILRGPASSLYGADAIGGVIQIFTRKAADDQTRFNAAAGYGSHNTRTAEAGVSAGAKGTTFGISVSSYVTDGFSAIRATPATPPKNRDDDGYWNNAVSAYAEHTFAPDQTLRAQFFQSRSRYHYDSNFSNFDNYGDETLRGYTLTSTNQLTDIWQSKLSWGVGFNDAEDHSAFGASDFRTTQQQITWQHDVLLPVGKLMLAYDRLEQEVKGVPNPTTTFRRDRDNDGFAAGYLLDEGKHLLQLSLREDHNTQYGAHTTGNIGYGYRFAPGWRISAGYGNAFKAPSFNMLYYPNFGNPDLKPEQSRNLEAALRYTGQPVSAGVVIFENRVRNLIQATGPAAGSCTFAGFCPVNVGKSRIRGLTADANWQITDQWALGGNFTVQSPRSIADDSGNVDGLLQRRAERYGTLRLDWASGAWRVGSELVGTSERFEDAANTKRMGGYALLNLTASYLINKDWKVEARADNVLDKDYVLAYTGGSPTAAPYNTPGATVFVGLRWQPQ
ncbi:MAG: TonB-dependent receptor [Methylobacillus sp.]|jgi:vitamin B12 transporter|nr:TonB-dependent receptor [Methylobacillus sp.]